MKKIILTTLFCIGILINTNAQSIEKNNGFQFQSISFGVGVWSTENKGSGPNFNLNFNTNIEKHLITASLSYKYEVDISFWGKSRQKNIYQSDLLYGYELISENKFKMEAFIGLGRISEDYTNSTSDWKSVSKSAVEIPIGMKFLFRPKKSFSFAINPNISFNEIETIYCINTIFQFNSQAK